MEKKRFHSDNFLKMKKHDVMLENILAEITCLLYTMHKATKPMKENPYIFFLLGIPGGPLRSSSHLSAARGGPLLPQLH